MSQETLFRTSPLGFNKLDVIEFITVQKKREAELLEEIELLKSKTQEIKPKSYSDKTDELLIANSRIADLNEAKLRLEQDLLELDERFAYAQKTLKEQSDTIEDLNTKIKEQDNPVENFNAKLSEKNGTIEDLNTKLAERDSAIEVLNIKLSEKDSTIEDLNTKLSEKDGAIEDLNKTTQESNLQNQSTKPFTYACSDISEAELEINTSLENQLGMAIIDARLYSQRIIRDAKIKSAQISADTYLYLNETTTKVEVLSQEMDLFKTDFDSTLRELSNKLDCLYKNLHGVSSDLAQKLGTDGEGILAKEAD